MSKTWVLGQKLMPQKMGSKFGSWLYRRAHHYKRRFAPSIAVRDGICETKIVHEALVTFDPIMLQKTMSTQNEGNYLRILNFWFKKNSSLKSADSARFTAAQAQNQRDFSSSGEPPIDLIFWGVSFCTKTHHLKSESDNFVTFNQGYCTWRWNFLFT